MADSDPVPTCPIVCAARRRPATFVAILIIAVVVPIFWKDIERLPRRFVPRNLGVVEEGRLYRSGQIHRSLLPGVLRDKGIESVVCLTYDPRQSDFDAEERIVRQSGGQYLLLPGLDGEGIGDGGDPGPVLCHQQARRGAGDRPGWSLRFGAGLGIEGFELARPAGHPQEDAMALAPTQLLGVQAQTVQPGRTQAGGGTGIEEAPPAHPPIPAHTYSHPGIHVRLHRRVRNSVELIRLQKMSSNASLRLPVFLR